jgi:hypothetical protein
MRDPYTCPYCDQRHVTDLSQDTIVKVQELKRLVYKYPKYWNPDGIIKLVTYNSINGDNKFLAQFRS